MNRRDCLHLFFAVSSTLLSLNVLADVKTGASTKTQDSSCLVIRAAFDIGSESTKMKVAQVDTCQHKIVKLLRDVSRKVAYAQDLSESKNGQFSELVQSEGIKAVKDLRAEAVISGATHFSGVATAAFRKSKNGERFAKELSDISKVSIKVITQQEEAVMGYEAALNSLDQKSRPSSMVVWDIGGSSQQLVLKDLEKKQYHFYDGQMAAVSFKNKVIQEINLKDPKEVHSPNPISQAQVPAAVALSAKVVEEIPANIKAAIAAPGSMVVGIGSVHGLSIVGQLATKNDFYTTEELQKTLQKQAAKTDAEIGGQYAATEVSNLILVLGMMNGLKLSKVHVRKVNLSDALLVE